MTTTHANTLSVNRVDPPAIQIVNTLPDLADVKMGAMVLLISDSATDDKKIHIKIASGWITSAALS